jgi:hypothetical protein
MYDEEEATGESGGAPAAEVESAPESQLDTAAMPEPGTEAEAEIAPATAKEAEGAAEAEARSAPDPEGGNTSE